MTAIFAGIVTFFFTSLLTIAGVGAAFILIPVFIALGVDLHTAMATALLLNAVAMVIASHRFIRHRLVIWRMAVPILSVATVLSPLGAYVSRSLDRQVLLWLFVVFLLVAAGMMLFYRPTTSESHYSRMQQIGYGMCVGGFAGFLGGLLGVGGGNFIVPVLIWLGYDPKKAAASTSFIIIFSSLSGFMGHMALGVLDFDLLVSTGLGSAGGAAIGAWLMTDRMKSRQVKLLVGIVLLGIAARMIWGLVG